MIEIANPVIYFPYGDSSATVIFPMDRERADDLRCLVQTLVSDHVLDRGYYNGEDESSACAYHRGVHIVAGWVESCIYPDHPQYGLRLDLDSWDPDDLDYTQTPTELSLDARLAAAAAVRVILDSAA